MTTRTDAYRVSHYDGGTPRHRGPFSTKLHERKERIVRWFLARRAEREFNSAYPGRYTITAARLPHSSGHLMNHVMVTLQGYDGILLFYTIDAFDLFHRITRSLHIGASCPMCGQLFRADFATFWRLEKLVEQIRSESQEHLDRCFGR